MSTRSDGLTTHGSEKNIELTGGQNKDLTH